MFKELLEMFAILSPVLGTLGGTFLGAWLTKKTQLELFSRQDKIEKSKEKRNRIEKTMKVYSEIVKANREVRVLTRVEGPFTFDREAYSEKIRPVIYDGFMHISYEIAEVVRDIDYTLSQYDFYNEELSSDGMASLFMKYEKLIGSIELEIMKYQQHIE